MAHDHHGHGHGHGHHHGAASAEEKAFIKSRSEGGAISRAINDTKARLSGQHWHRHGEHAHTYDISKGGKIAIVAGATASLGVALHGADNMRRGALGYKDKELNQEYAPSASRFLLGAAEVVGGLALAKRICTGQWKL